MEDGFHPDQTKKNLAERAVSVILGPPNKSLLGKAIISLLQGKIYEIFE